ncbi:MAG: V-type ATP synthase subunit D [Pontiellaceae bacterium]|nr:V-type ATP synthase subunit D [Kiritimatiellaceae bacterium]HBO87569.1 V-type ATP synthase subunit D [Verrucomicrobiota bacterium]|tara:strand:- start:1028 stop:1615 length:588 start_codon:yes stop_codon:yes gene_type:complete
MAKIKLTKNELKSQRDALKRFQRYLPTLQLKKQQLQMEMRKLDLEINKKRQEEKAARSSLASWIHLYSEPIDLSEYVSIQRLKTSRGNIAGVNIPILEDLEFHEDTPDLFETDAWIDQGVDTLKQLMRLRVERQVMEEQHRLLSEELRTTTQRVNLFEKVKIPEAKENIRVIRIFMGDQQTASVARSKIAKGKGA